jgi:uncharacterized protein YdcH (DUF465 family)
MPLTDPLQDELLERDTEFRVLFEEHQDSDRRLQELIHKSSLTPEEEALEKQIKLHKLVLKDRMQAKLHAHRSQLERERSQQTSSALANAAPHGVHA